MQEPLDPFQTAMWSEVTRKMIVGGGCRDDGGKYLHIETVVSMAVLRENPDAQRAILASSGPLAIRGDEPMDYRQKFLKKLCCQNPLYDRAGQDSYACVVECLVTKYEVDPNNRNIKGGSGLELASRKDNFDVCKVLVRRGATLTAYALEHYGADHDLGEAGEGEDEEDEDEEGEDEEGEDEEDENEEGEDGEGEDEEDEEMDDEQYEQQHILLMQQFQDQIQLLGQRGQDSMRRLREIEEIEEAKPAKAVRSDGEDDSLLAAAAANRRWSPLSEEAKDERRAALLLLLPEPQRRAEQLTPFRHAANWRRRRNLMMFLAEGGHRPLSYRVTAGQADLPAAVDRRTSLTGDIFSEEKGVAHLIMAML